MEPPATPRKPRRPKEQTDKLDTDQPEFDAPAKPKGRPIVAKSPAAKSPAADDANKQTAPKAPRSTKKATPAASTASTNMATDNKPSAVSPTASSDSTLGDPVNNPMSIPTVTASISTDASEASAPASDSKVNGGTVSAPVDAAATMASQTVTPTGTPQRRIGLLDHDEPDIFKPIDSTAPVARPIPSQRPISSGSGSTNTGSNSKSPRPGQASQETIDKLINSLRTLMIRNIDIGRRTMRGTGTAARQGASQIAKPLSAAGRQVGELGQRSSNAVNNSVDQWQKSLETSDTAVIVTTFVFIGLCIAVTTLIVLAVR